MMDNLRSASNHVALKIILGIIIISFVLTGVSNYLIGGTHDYAAKVNGETISRAQFENAFNNERARQQQQLGDQYAQLAANEQFLQQLRQQALSQLIDQTLLQQYVHKLNLTVTDEQIKQAIFAVPQFQTNGHFDNALYNSVLNSVGYKPAQYAASLRNSLPNQQLAQAIGNTDFLLKGEADQLVNLVSQQRQIRQAVIDVNALAAKQQVNADEINSYYQAHQADFKIPEQFKVSYIKLDAKAMEKTPSEQDIQAWYDNHKTDYSQQARQRYSVIQVKTEQQANDVLKQLHDGANFADLARQYSQDPVSAKQGGDLGWMEMDAVPEELTSAKLSTKGEISGVIKSSVGDLIVRLDDVQPEQLQPLSAVHQAVADKVRQDAAITQFYALQQKVNDAASNDNDSLAGAEQVAGTKAVETSWFTQQSVPSELNFDAVKDVIFNGSLLGAQGTPGSNSSIITVDGNRAFVVRITAHQPVSVKPQSEVTGQITDAIKHDKALAVAKAEAESIVAELGQGKQTRLTQAGIQFGASQTLQRNQQSAVTETVFNLTPPQGNTPSYGFTQDNAGNVVIIALDKVTTGDMPAEQRAQMVEGITQNNAQLIFMALLEQLRQEAKIKYGDALQLQ
ncbi:peptidylprolyl isomerase [Rosenbergiella australiborealis]|uniref:Periplasmic chaperone PpiD n=2 Tax=Rosenbergiella TaxID=1356488 RepID=A0ABS5T9B4_9GAMM|nr:peptidylprolyl isomerase [Rosenbergiella australiborealis]MBT0728100.1 peptidylprolyl isomerase [Rosenbergiella australiborealis]